MEPGGSAATVESIVLPHLDAAYRLARWLSGNEQDARDVVQDACVRALRGLGGFRGGDSRAWFLTIVRNVAFTRLHQNREVAELDESLYEAEEPDVDPQSILLRAEDASHVRQAIEDLPPELRTVIVLREIEGLSYKQIASVAEVPIGTVMSRLARGRQRLATMLSPSESPREQA